MRVLVGVDAPILRRGLSVTLAEEPTVEVVGWASAPLDLVGMVETTRPQVVLCWFESLRSSMEVAQAVAGHRSSPSRPSGGTTTCSTR